MTKDKEFLRPHQQIALAKMHNGCILCGGTGSGKSRTGLYYFFQQSGGRIDKSGYHPVGTYGLRQFGRWSAFCIPTRERAVYIRV